MQSTLEQALDGYTDEDDTEPCDGVAALVLPGTEDPKELMRRGGIDLNWTAKDGTTRRVTKYREVPMQHVVDQDLALPTLYLHFLNKEFFLKEGEYNLSLRAGNDNSEIQLVLPQEMVPSRNTLPETCRASFDVVMRFIRSQSEVMSSSVDEKPGGFGPKKNLKATIQTRRLYYSLKTARPKAGISLDKASFGIPEDAELYLFAENHASVNYMSKRDTEAFEECISELLDLSAEVVKFGIFLKLFYEGGFAYNKKLQMGKGYLPQNIGLACMGVTPAFEGQSGISTGYPYLLPSRFLSYCDTVPVTIGAISGMSSRHARYGLCFTRCVYVWETEALAREGVLNFCSITPHGGFFYLPSTLRGHWKLGGFVYAFGEAKDGLEMPVAIDNTEGASGAASALAQPQAASAANRQACVICLTEDAVFATVPCGHRAFCADCQSAAKGRNCPVCRTPVRDVLRVY